MPFPAIHISPYQLAAMSLSANTNTHTHMLCDSRNHTHSSLLFTSSSHPRDQLRPPLPFRWDCCSALSSSASHWLPGTGARRAGWRETKRGSRGHMRALADAAGNGSSKEGTPANATISKSRREILLEYVRNVQPEFLELFVKIAPQQVVDAMRQTVTNMIGTLPPQFFTVTVTTVAENLAQLMYSVLVTGYMFKNAQYRLELQQSVEQVALPDAKGSRSDPDYAPGTRKKVSGEVIRWHNDSGPEKMDAVKYIEILEAEINELQQQLERRRASNGQNEILDYLKSLEPQNLQELTSSAGEDALEAMNTFIQRLLGVSDPAQLKATSISTHLRWTTHHLGHH